MYLYVSLSSGRKVQTQNICNSGILVRVQVSRSIPHIFIWCKWGADLATCLLSRDMTEKRLKRLKTLFQSINQSSHVIDSSIYKCFQHGIGANLGLHYVICPKVPFLRDAGCIGCSYGSFQKYLLSWCIMQPPFQKPHYLFLECMF